MNELLRSFGDPGGAGILLALFFGTFLSEDLACLSAGSLVADGRLDLASAVVACFAGIFVGDLLLYGAGRVLGSRVLTTDFASRFVTQDRIDSANDWLRDRGASVIFVSRFVSGLRLPTYLAAGALKLDPRKFTLYLVIAAAVWTPLIVGTAAVWQKAIPGSFVFGIVLGFIGLRIALKLTDRKKRRLAWGAIQRILQWEFWPLYVFYFPVIVYVILLGLRHHSITMFTAANPAIPAGGFVGESKDEIYKLLRSSSASNPYLLKHKKISGSRDADRKYRHAIRFIDDNSLSFPIVIKPDAGERGDGVSIVQNDAQLRVALRGANGHIIVQEFFEGVEASVFYFRFPNGKNGQIFSITEKHFPKVIGDGKSTLEELILRDRRAFIIARKYFERFAGHLRSIPGAGERVRLVEIGSHSKGAVFRDGEHLRSPKLEAKIDEICRGIDGFFFGRFDLRAALFDDLKSGKNFRIIELNGVTSESTNIYDPRYNLIDAYRILFNQWRLAFEVGGANARSGAPVTTVRQLLSLILGKKCPRNNVRPFHRLSPTPATSADRTR